MAAGRTWVGVDVGGTKVLAGVVDFREDGVRVLRTARRSTPGRDAKPADLEDVIAEAVAEAADGQALTGVGIAAAGFVDAAGERVRFAPHLPWRDAPVRDRLAHRWGIPVVLDNDANAAAWAEWRYGAARGADSALLVTVGTGIGGALVLDGRLHRGRNGMAGEFGHMRVLPDGRPCPCGGVGCWEQYASGSALVRTARAALAELGEDDPGRLTGEFVTDAAAQGDPVALRAFAEVGEWLGVGLANLVAAFDPDRVVVGGGVAAAGDLLLDPARAALERALVAGTHRDLPDVVPAELGPEAGLVGAATLARSAPGVGATPPA